MFVLSIGNEKGVTVYIYVQPGMNSPEAYPSFSALITSPALYE